LLKIIKNYNNKRKNYKNYKKKFSLQISTTDYFLVRPTAEILIPAVHHLRK